MGSARTALAVGGFGRGKEGPLEGTARGDDGRGRGRGQGRGRGGPGPWAGSAAGKDGRGLRTAVGGDGRIRDDQGRNNGRGRERGRPSPWAGSAGLGDGPQLSARRRLRQRLGVDLSLAVETVHVLLVATACLVGLAVTFRWIFFVDWVEVLVSQLQHCSGGCLYGCGSGAF